jgi:hypothetical protein
LQWWSCIWKMEFKKVDVGEMDTIQHWRKTKCLIEFFEHISM